MPAKKATKKAAPKKTKAPPTVDVVWAQLYEARETADHLIERAMHDRVPALAPSDAAPAAEGENEAGRELRGEPADPAAVRRLPAVHALRIGM